MRSLHLRRAFNSRRTKIKRIIKSLKRKKKHAYNGETYHRDDVLFLLIDGGVLSEEGNNAAWADYQNDTTNAIDLWKWDNLTQNPCSISSSQRESGSERPRLSGGKRSALHIFICLLFIGAFKAFMSPLFVRKWIHISVLRLRNKYKTNTNVLRVAAGQTCMTFKGDFWTIIPARGRPTARHLCWVTVWSTDCQFEINL